MDRPIGLHTHTFPLDELPTALRYARERIDGARRGGILTYDVLT